MKLQPLLQHQRTKGLVAVEIIAQEGDAMGRHPLGMFGKPAFARSAFTVLFVMPVLRHDVLRRQGNDLGMSRAHDHRGDRGMIIEGLAIAELTPETVVAMNGFGRKVVGAIEGHQQLIAKDPKSAPTCGAVQDPQRPQETPHRGGVGDRIEQRADLIVTGNLLHAKEGVGVIVPFGVLQPALVSKNDGDWVKKMPKAPKAASWMAYWVLGLSLRWSGK